MDPVEIIFSYIGSFIISIPISGFVLYGLFIPFKRTEPNYKRYLAFNLTVLFLGVVGIFYFINFGGGRYFWESDEKKNRQFLWNRVLLYINRNSSFNS